MLEPTVLFLRSCAGGLLSKSPGPRRSEELVRLDAVELSESDALTAAADESKANEVEPPANASAARRRWSTSVRTSSSSW